MIDKTSFTNVFKVSYHPTSIRQSLGVNAARIEIIRNIKYIILNHIIFGFSV